MNVLFLANDVIVTRWLNRYRYRCKIQDTKEVKLSDTGNRTPLLLRAIPQSCHRMESDEH